MEGERSPSSQELGRDSPFSWAQLPSSMLADSDWFGDEHIQAKRARVETIIRGMCVSPNPLVPGNTPNTNSPCCPEKSRERKRKQSLPIQQGPLRPRSAQDQGSRMGSPRVREQLHLLKQQLQHLQEHILQSAKPGAHAQGLRGPFSAQQRNGCSSNPRVAVSAQYQSSNKHIHGAETHKVAEGRQQPEEPGDLPSAAQALLEILRKEVITVVAQAVDAVFQKVLMDLPDNLTQGSTSCQGLVAESRSEQSPPEGGGSKDPLAPASLPRRVQPQAGIPLESSSLTKPLESPKHPLSPGRAPKPYQGPPGNCSFTVPSYIQENQVYNQLPGHGPSSHWSRGPPQDSSSSSLPSAESAQHSWVLNQHHLSLPFMAAHLESLPLPPSVKTEQNGLQTVADTLPFSSIHEGLHPGHLKKAKLMFFYTRYPSSNLLKAYFPDVQFNRCITSQMIKWFSNFREFYYIQMEKSARQAISDGVTNPKMLVLLRDSELFRALNMHYNKGNDLEVPDCFLEVASLTLQEFFRAVVAGKDSDPSWKKPIYKIISKLDSNIPEIFKSPSYPQELFHN